VLARADRVIKWKCWVTSAEDWGSDEEKFTCGSALNILCGALCHALRALLSCRGAANKESLPRGLSHAVDREIATATYDSVSSAYSEDGTVPQDGLRLVIEEAKKNAKISREISINQVADLSMLKQAQTEIGFKRK
jgi:hypothetical protein